MLVQVCGCAVIHCCYAVVMRLLLLCCCCYAVVLLLLVVKCFFVLCTGLSWNQFCYLVYGWDLFRGTSISLVCVWLKSI